MELTEEQYVEILQRYPWNLENVITDSLKRLEGQKILITGASGSLGTQLMEEIDSSGLDIEYIGIDVVESETHSVVIRDVTSYYDLSWIAGYKDGFDTVFHFAADKHAPHGEDNPQQTLAINIAGTENLLKCFSNSHIVFSSTCKACDPETVYGATKLIGERMVLNAGHTVARYYNVIESAGNVFEIWDNTDPEDRYVTNCYRYFITARESLALTLYAATHRGGRYVIQVGNATYMPELYRAFYGGANFSLRSPRRGDRVAEPRMAKNECYDEPLDVAGILKVINYHDATPE